MSGSVDAECTECRWNLIRHTVDELSRLSGESRRDIIEQHADQHEMATNHETKVYR